MFRFGQISDNGTHGEPGVEQRACQVLADKTRSAGQRNDALAGMCFKQTSPDGVSRWPGLEPVDRLAEIRLDPKPCGRGNRLWLGRVTISPMRFVAGYVAGQVQ